MGEVLVRYSTRLTGEDGESYEPRACGAPAADGLWEGWIEFVAKSGDVLRTGRETEQPNRDALMYWAQGLTDTYLEGALSRALSPRTGGIPAEPVKLSAYPGPATGRPLTTGAAARPVLDPFATYAEGEQLLRDQLGALSRDNLVNIVKGYRIDVGRPHDELSDAGLIEGIVDAARGQSRA